MVIFDAIAQHVGLVGLKCLLGQYFIFGALYPSKSGLMNKHIVKHIGALFPSKSGLMNKHIVKKNVCGAS